MEGERKEAGVTDRERRQEQDQVWVQVTATLLYQREVERLRGELEDA